MHLDRLKIFHAVAKYQSFTHASEKLFLTQPGISKHVRLLEEFYGTRLFDRLGKKIALTRAGEILYEATKDMFSLLDEAKARIDDIEGLAAGTLHVGASFTIGIYIAPNFLAKLAPSALDTCCCVLRSILFPTKQIGASGQYLCTRSNHNEILSNDSREVTS